jgi:ubiquinone/menaquinone biosynthesis C-methylase UbiE
LSIEKAYDSWSEIYDANENKTRDLDKQATIKALEQLSFNRVLEIGCGTGKNTVFFAQKAKEVFAMDFSIKMLSIARKKVKESQIHFIQADINQEWDVPNLYFDLISCNLVLEHISDLDLIFKKAKQKLAVNGKIFISELHPIKQYLGSKACFDTKNGVQELEVFIHHLTDYIDSAYQEGFELIEIKEWFDKDQIKETIPRLISFVFESKK